MTNNVNYVESKVKHYASIDGQPARSCTKKEQYIYPTYRFCGFLQWVIVTANTNIETQLNSLFNLGLASQRADQQFQEKRDWPNVGLMLVQRRRRWPSIKLTSAKWFVLVGCVVSHTKYSLVTRTISNVVTKQHLSKDICAWLYIILLLLLYMFDIVCTLQQPFQV